MTIALTLRVTKNVASEMTIFLTYRSSEIQHIVVLKHIYFTFFFEKGTKNIYSKKKKKKKSEKLLSLCIVSRLITVLRDSNSQPEILGNIHIVCSIQLL